jgi:hypothetical protein
MVLSSEYLATSCIIIDMLHLMKFNLKIIEFTGTVPFFRTRLCVRFVAASFTSRYSIQCPHPRCIDGVAYFWEDLVHHVYGIHAITEDVFGTERFPTVQPATAEKSLFVSSDSEESRPGYEVL